MMKERDEVIKALNEQLVADNGSATKAAKILGKTNTGSWYYHLGHDTELAVLMCALALKPIVANKDYTDEIILQALKLAKGGGRDE